MYLCIYIQFECLSSLIYMCVCTYISWKRAHRLQKTFSFHCFCSVLVFVWVLFNSSPVCSSITPFVLLILFPHARAVIVYVKRQYNIIQVMIKFSVFPFPPKYLDFCKLEQRGFQILFSYFILYSSRRLNTPDRFTWLNLTQLQVLVWLPGATKWRHCTVFYLEPKKDWYHEVRVFKSYSFSGSS